MLGEHRIFGAMLNNSSATPSTAPDLAEERFETSLKAAREQYLTEAELTAPSTWLKT